MSKQRVVKDEIWDDEWFYDLDPSEKLVWLFLLTNPRTNITGVFKINTRWIANLTGFDKDVIKTILTRFVDDGKIVYEDDWIALINFHKHLAYKNPSVALGIKRLGETLTGCPQAVYSVYLTLLNSTLLNSNGADAPIKKNMAWKHYNENKHSDDLPVVDSESGEVVGPDAQEKAKNKELTQKKNRAIDWLIEYQNRDVLKTNRPKQMKALNEILKMGVSLREAADMVKEQMVSEYWIGKKEKPDFSTVAAIIQKRG